MAPLELIVYQAIIGELEALEREGHPITNANALAARLASLVALSGRLEVRETAVKVTR